MRSWRRAHRRRAGLTRPSTRPDIRASIGGGYRAASRKGVQEWSYPFGEHLREVINGTLLVFLWGEDGGDARAQADAFAAACALLDVTVLVRHSAPEGASVVFLACHPPTDQELAAAVAEVRHQCEPCIPAPRLAGSVRQPGRGDDSAH